MTANDTYWAEDEAVEQAIRSPLLTPVMEGATLDKDDIDEFLSWRLHSNRNIEVQVSASR